MRRLFVADMDGTLLHNDKSLPSDFAETVAKVNENGDIFAFGSGRPYQNLKPKYGKYSDNFAYVCDNGATVVYHDNVLYQDVLSDEELAEVDALSELSERLILVFNGVEHFFVKFTSEPTEDELRELLYYYPEYTKVASYREVNESIIKVALLYVDDIQAHIADKIHLREGLLHPVTAYVWIDVYHDCNSKGIGISKIQESLGITKENTFVFGDYYNDISMADVADHSYAMGNAVDEVKEVFTEVIGTNEDDAVTKKIQEVLHQQN